MRMNFHQAAQRALDRMEELARGTPMAGVALTGYAAEDGQGAFEYRVVDRLTRAPENGTPANFFAIACSKAGEMLDTLKDSGSGARPPIQGEFGYQGGVIAPFEGGALFAVFSGGTSQEDLDAARAGLEALKAGM